MDFLGRKLDRPDPYGQIIASNGGELRKDRVIIRITSVYARCSNVERLQLWDELEYIEGNDFNPWILGGDFNVILNKEEKLGGLPLSTDEASDFQHCINNCALKKVQLSRSRFTW